MSARTASKRRSQNGKNGAPRGQGSPADSLTLHFWPPELRKYVLVVLSHLVCGPCYSSHGKLTPTSNKLLRTVILVMLLAAGLLWRKEGPQGWVSAS